MWIITVGAVEFYSLLGIEVAVLMFINTSRFLSQRRNALKFELEI